MCQITFVFTRPSINGLWFARMFCFDGTLQCLSVPACNPCEPAAVDSGLRRARLRKWWISLASLSFSQRNT